MFFLKSLGLSQIGVEFGLLRHCIYYKILSLLLNSDLLLKVLFSLLLDLNEAIMVLLESTLILIELSLVLIQSLLS